MRAPRLADRLGRYGLTLRASAVAARNMGGGTTGYPVRNHPESIHVLRRRRLRRAAWLGLSACVGLTGCLSQELVKSVVAENIALSVTTLIQPLIDNGLDRLLGLGT